LIPRYDKSAFDGKGDRMPEGKCSVFNMKPNLLIVEGWMLGFKPLDSRSDDAKMFFEKYPGMEDVNEFLKEYEPQWENNFDARILVEVEDSNIVF
jgi:D-glycerate 3-kinase